jgi:signal transduction histidine kinase
MIGLLTNAFTTTPPPGTGTGRGRHDSEGEVILEVIDTGTGIPAAELERVFERFYRVDRARSRDTGGTGLGLAIVRAVAEAHGGYVELESEPSSGSRFTIVLPTSTGSAER